MKKAKDKFLSYSNIKSRPILYKCIREFYNDTKELTPSNYMIIIQKDLEAEGERPSFVINMFLNNKPTKFFQKFEIEHNFNQLENGATDQEFFNE
jgi:hypothetical protein